VTSHAAPAPFHANCDRFAPFHGSLGWMRPGQASLSRVEPGIAAPTSDTVHSMTAVLIFRGSVPANGASVCPRYHRRAGREVTSARRGRYGVDSAFPFVEKGQVKTLKQRGTSEYICRWRRHHS